MAAAMPQPAQDRFSFIASVREFHRNLCEHAKTVAEIKAAIYVFDNTVVFQEFDQAKKITLDEFANGRKRRDGSRMDSGSGIKGRHNIIAGLRLAERHQILYSQCDDSDAARIEKLYAPRLTLPSKPASQRLQVVTSDSTVKDNSTVAGGSTVEPQRLRDRTSEVTTQNPGGYAVEPRTEKVPVVSADSKCLEESTSIAPIGASVEVEEVRYPLQGHKAIAQVQEPISISPTHTQLEIDLDRARNDLRNAKQHGGTSKRIRDLERAINDIHAQIAALRDLSDSQEQEASPSTALYEEKPQDEKPALRIVPRLKVHQQQYIEWQADLANKRQSLEDWKSATSAAEEEWRTCPTTSKRRELHLEYLACQDEVRRLEHSIAKAEIFLQLIEDGADPQDAAKEAKERAGLQPLHDDHSNEPEQPALPEMEAEPAQETQEEKQPATLYQVLGSLFYDMEHANERDKKTAAIIAGKIAKRGLTVEDVQERYRRWLRKFDALKAKTIFHFEQHICDVGVAL